MSSWDFCRCCVDIVVVVFVDEAECSSHYNTNHAASPSFREFMRVSIRRPSSVPASLVKPSRQRTHTMLAVPESSDDLAKRNHQESFSSQALQVHLSKMIRTQKGFIVCKATPKDYDAMDLQIAEKWPLDLRRQRTVLALDTSAWTVITDAKGTILGV